VLGKFGGSVLAARLTSLGWRDSVALRILNTRGLMELIVLNIGLDLKVISPTLFAMLVIMVVVTTFAITPILTRSPGALQERGSISRGWGCDQRGCYRKRWR
jgi:Kef-type K+ transport system membrane component KefB